MKTSIALFLTFLTTLSLASAQDCTISNVFAEADLCEDDGTFFVAIEFEVENPAGNTFEIRGNGESYGFFNYGEPFYTVGPLEGNCETLYEFVVIDVTNDGCSDFYEFTSPICCSDECVIYNISLDSIQCNDNGTYDFLLNFDHVNTTNAFFDVIADTTFIGFYSYDSLPVWIENFIPRDVEYDLIRICDNDNPDCCLIHEFLKPECLETDCSINDLFVEPYCDGELSFLDFEFNAENTGNEGFTVFGNGVNYGSFEYGETFYTIGPSDNCEAIDEIFIVDNQFESCNTGVVIFAQGCCNNGECDIRDLVAEVYCDSVGLIYVGFEFIAENVGNDGFTVRGNGKVYGSFEYGETFYEIGPFDNCDALDELVVIDNQFEACNAAIELSNSECCEDGECSIRDLFAEVYCDSSGLVFVDFEFISENTGSDGFTVRGDGNVYGSFNYGETFYTIGPFENCDDLNELIVIDTQFEECQDDIGLQNAPCCASNECEIFDLEVEFSECDGEFFLVNFSFLSNNTSQSFTVRGNGNIYENFAYNDDNFYTIGPFNGCEPFNELVIIDNDFLDCSIDIAVEKPNCCEEACTLADLEMIGMECFNDTVVAIVYNFEPINTGGLGHDVFLNGEFHSFQTYGNNNYIIEFSHSHEETIALEVCDNDNPDCCASITLNCDTPNECALESITAQQTECVVGEYFYVINVAHNFNEGSLPFNLRGNGANYGDYTFNDLPVTLGPFEIQEDLINELVLVMPSLEEDCSLEIALDPSCETLNTNETFVQSFNFKQGYGYLIIEAAQFENNTCRLFSIDGRLLQSQDFENTMQLNTLHYPTGVYFVAVKNENGRSLIKKIILSN